MRLATKHYMIGPHVSQSLPKIAVITVNWNRPHLTTQCYNALLASVGVDWHLFVVDNGSTDDSRTVLSNLGPRATFLDTGVNSGWAGGNNTGLKRAITDGFEWFFLLNNDATVESLTIVNLWQNSKSAQQKPAVTGSIQLDEDDDSCFYGSHMTSNMLFTKYLNRREFDAMPDVFRTPFIKGAALFCHRSHLEEIGFFEERYFLNYEEAEWCLRANRAGFDVLMVKSSKVRHSGSGSMGGLSSPISTYFLVRNQLLYAERNGGALAILKASSTLLNWACHKFRTKYKALGAIRAARSTLPWAVAWKLGIKDYIFRRFGDCPQVIRSLTYSPNKEA